MIKYIGSKRTLLPAIVDVVRRAAPEARSIIDLFSGTSRVGHAFKAAGFRVLANDYNAYAETLARCYVAADRADVERDALSLLDEFGRLPGRPGWFTRTYCDEARFLQPKNGARVEAIRAAIAAKDLDPELEAVLLVALMEAADRVDSTTGVQMAYLKSWAPRAAQDLELRLPAVLPRAAAGKGEAHRLDGLDAARTLEADVAYLDPPYNQHSYLGNYHLWETLVRWDRPAVYGVARKRVECRERKSVFNSRPRCAAALAEVLGALRVDTVVVSFSDEGYLARAELEGLLGGLWGGRAHVATLAHDFKRYVGAQIGIHSPSGAKVGAVSHLRNVEYLYVASRRGLPQSFADDARALGTPRRA